MPAGGVPDAKLGNAGAAHENVIDARAGRREAPGVGQPAVDGCVACRVEVACEHDDVVRRREVDDELDCSEQFGRRDARVARARAVRVGDGERPAVVVRESRDLDDAALLRPGEPHDDVQAQGGTLVIAKAARVQRLDVVEQEPQARPHLNRVSLTGEERAEEPVVRGGEQATDVCRDRKRAEARRGSPIPHAEARKRPRRNLLHAEHIRVVRGREAHHLVEVGVATWRHRVAVEQVPAAYEHLSTLLRCASSSLIRLRSPPGTTTSLRPRSRAQAPTSSSSRRGFDSAQRPSRTATPAAATSTRLLHGSSNGHG